uniref:Uncharacterized protein n=1 Tax=Anguilla anguilla TaxID=7936 RepID=A0A0E9W6I9_ANGAN
MEYINSDPYVHLFFPYLSTLPFPLRSSATKRLGDCSGVIRANHIYR